MRRWLAVGCLASAWAYAQTAGARAVASVDRLPVYPKMSTASAPVWQLSKGDAVQITLVLFGDEITWCAISRVGESKRLGYVSCDQLTPDRGTEGAGGPPDPPAAATPATPAAPPQPREPIRIREVPSTPPAAARVREITPQAAAALVNSAREAGVLPDPSALSAKLPSSPPPEQAVPTAGLPAPPGSPVDDLFVRLLRGSGVDAELRRFLETANPVSFLEKSRLQHVDADALRGAAASHLRRFVAEEDDLVKLLASRFHAGEKEALAAFLDQPAARKLERASAAAAAPGAHGRLVEFARELQQNPPPEARLALIHRIHAGMGLTLGEIDVTLGAVRAIALAMNPVLPERLRFTTEQLEAGIEEVRAHYEAVARNAAVVHLLFLHRELTDAELEDAARFWESEAGQRLSLAVREGLAAAGTKAAKQIAMSVPPASPDGAGSRR
jgi:hypothetical protein